MAAIVTRTYLRATGIEFRREKKNDKWNTGESMCHLHSSRVRTLSTYNGRLYVLRIRHVDILLLCRVNGYNTRIIYNVQARWSYEIWTLLQDVRPSRFTSPYDDILLDPFTWWHNDCRRFLVINSSRSSNPAITVDLTGTVTPNCTYLSPQKRGKYAYTGWSHALQRFSHKS